MSAGLHGSAYGRVLRGGRSAVRRREYGWLARAGLVARGVVYGVIGVLSLELALGVGGKATSQQGALETIAHEPLGKVLLLALALGLAGYATWRLVRAALGHGREDSDSALDRVAGLGSAVAYGALCVVAVSILVGGSGGSSSPERETAGVLGWPGGTVFVALAGAILLGVAAYQGYKGLSRKFLDDTHTARMSREVERAFTTIGVLGHLARGVVLALVGYGLIEAAVDYSPRRAVGLGGALSKLAHSSDGPLFLGVVAAGLIAFALYSIADARYRRV
jgi:hypothetical protein